MVRSNAAFSAGEADLTVLSDAPERVEPGDRLAGTAIGGQPALVRLGLSRLQDPEQVVHAVIERERIALEVQEEVPAAGCRQAEEPPVPDELSRLVAVERQQLPAWCRQAVGLDLDPGLLADPSECVTADPFDPRAHGQLQPAERTPRPDAPRLQRRSVARGRPGHEREIVVRPAPRRAVRRPAADLAVLDGLRVGGDRRVDRCRDRDRTHPDRLLELGLDPAVVGHHLVHAVGCLLTGAAAEDDVQELRLAALDDRQLVHVGADLEDGARRHVPRQLRVGHLVVPRPEGAVRFVRSVVPAQQEVRVAAPATR